MEKSLYVMLLEKRKRTTEKIRTEFFLYETLFSKKSTLNIRRFLFQFNKFRCRLLCLFLLYQVTENTQ